MDGGNWKEMYHAVQIGDVDLLRYHLSMEIDPNYQHPEVLGLPIVAAVQQGNLEMVQLLLKHGADPELKDAWEGHSALEVARKTKQRELEKLIRDHLGLPMPKQNWLQRLLGS